MNAIEYLRTKNITKIILCAQDAATLDTLNFSLLNPFPIMIRDKRSLEERHIKAWDIRDFGLYREFEAVVIVQSDKVGPLYNAVSSYMPLGRLVLPFNPKWIAPYGYGETRPRDFKANSTNMAEYVQACGLKGAYAEFGTFFGRQFFKNYFLFHTHLKGGFFGFDSFCGLSSPEQIETEFSGGQFIEGQYSCNVDSFRAIGDLMQIPRKEYQLVEGYFEDTLNNETANKLGLVPKSISVCIVDCDIKEPTEQVLSFVTDLLEDGALIYFDDWRLCRASPHVGERAAALAWLKEHPEIELIDFPTPHWFGQTFIFQRR